MLNKGPVVCESITLSVRPQLLLALFACRGLNPSISLHYQLSQLIQTFLSAKEDTESGDALGQHGLLDNVILITQ